MPRQAKGDYSIDEQGCPRFNYDRCSGVFVALDIRNDVNASQARFSCTLQSGSIRISSVSSAHVVGEFAGVGSCITYQGEVVDGFQLVNGQFDVALRDGLRS